MQNLLPNIKIDLVAAVATTGTTDITGATLDMQGYDGVMFFITLATANAGNFLKAQQDTDSAMGTAADLAGSKVTSGTSDEVLVLDIFRPLKRYVRGVLVRAGATTVSGQMYAVRYNLRNMPKTNDLAGTILTKILASPAEGTP